LNSNCQWTG